MKRVLIIDYHFPPINNINARRFGGMVSHMPEFGWEPIVLTTKSKGSLPVLIPEKNIIRLGENYYDEKKIIASNQGYKGIPKVLKVPYFFYKTFGAELSSVDRFIFQWGKEVMKNKEAIKKRNFDLIIASCYPPVAIWLGKFLSKETKKPWLADLQDPLSLWNNSKFPLFKLLDRKIDKFLIRNTAAVLTISSHLASRMENLYHKPVEIIYNGFDKADDFKSLKRNILRKRKIKKLYYAGRFHEHRMPAVKLLIDWLAESDKKNVLFSLRSLGPMTANEEIIKYAKKKDVFEKIKLLPPASPEIIFREEKEADILILFEDLEKKMQNSEGTLPGKLMEYLPFRAPIVAINRSDSEIEKVLKETSRGYLVSNPEQLNGVMEKIFNNSEPKFNWNKVKVYSRRSQSENLCKILDKTYEGRNF